MLKYLADPYWYNKAGIVSTHTGMVRSLLPVLILAFILGTGLYTRQTLKENPL